MSLENVYEELHAKLRDMISWSNNDQKYYTGREIKDIVTKCIESEKNLGIKIREHNEFYDRYVASEFPLSNNSLYCITKKCVGIGNWVMKCYKKQ